MFFKFHFQMVHYQCLNKTDFVLTLYPASLLNSFISCNNYFVASLWCSTYKITSSEKVILLLPFKFRHFYFSFLPNFSVQNFQYIVEQQWEGCQIQQIQTQDSHAEYKIYITMNYKNLKCTSVLTVVHTYIIQTSVKIQNITIAQESSLMLLPYQSSPYSLLKQYLLDFPPTIDQICLFQNFIEMESYTINLFKLGFFH